MTDAYTGLELRSEISAQGQLKLSLVDVALDAPGADEVIVKVEAAPINPSDLGLLLGPADVATAKPGGTDTHPELVMQVPAERLGGVKGRLDQSMAVGNEGAGTVVAAGPGAEALVGKRVGMLGGGMYTQYRKLKTRDVVALPDGASAADGASMFVNPLTALGFVETARMEGHKAIIHTAAASNLGQMLVKLCKDEGVPLVNIVRSAEQAKILTDLGAEHVVDSTDPDFHTKLVDAIAATEAFLAFDAIGGGKLVNQILAAMEAAALRVGGPAQGPYGSRQFKQVYIYGGLSTEPTVITRGVGMQWGVGGFLVSYFLERVGAEETRRLREKVGAEITTTFASAYTQRISLEEAVQPDVIRAYHRKATGEKYLVMPNG